jgi:hypothetical protein
MIETWIEETDFQTKEEEGMRAVLEKGVEIAAMIVIMKVKKRQLNRIEIDLERNRRRSRRQYILQQPFPSHLLFSQLIPIVRKNKQKKND